MEIKMNLSVLQEELGLGRLGPDASVPAWATQGEFYTVSRTKEELSVVCESRLIPDAVRAERGWKALKVEGPLDFSLVGILAALSGTLAERGVSIFAISTFDTDYILIKKGDLDQAVAALRDAGHDINE